MVRLPLGEDCQVAFSTQKKHRSRTTQAILIHNLARKLPSNPSATEGNMVDGLEKKIRTKQIGIYGLVSHLLQSVRTTDMFSNLS